MGEKTKKGKRKVKEVSWLDRKVYHVNNLGLSSQCVSLAVHVKETKVNVLYLLEMIVVRKKI